jgi:hypothetical protein
LLLVPAARDAGDVLLPLLAEGQHQEISHEGLILTEGDRFAAAQA